MTGFDRPTLDFYAEQAREYVSYRPDAVGEELPPFLATLAPRACILELGCGGGSDAQFMIARDFDVVPTDGVAAIAAIAEERLGRTVRVMRFDELVAVADYDAVVALASLLHVPRDDLAAVIGRVWRALRPGGRFLATFKTGAAAGYDEHGRYYNYITADDALGIYRSGGAWLSVVSSERDGNGYFSAPARWLTVVATKSSGD